MFSDKDIVRLLRDAQEELRAVLPEDLESSSNHLVKQYSEQDILNVFRICLIRPSGKSWAPMWQVFLLLYQAAFSESYTSEKDKFQAVGNYILYRMPELKNPIIYSFGVGQDVSFDDVASKLFDVPIYMYDPTPAVLSFMEAHKDNPKFIFKSEGIYTEDSEFKLYTSGNPNKANSSLYPIHGDQGEFTMVKCKTLQTIMRENGHSHIDVLKMDIEGVAGDVLNQMLDETNVRPKQIVAEFEVRGIENPLTYLPKLAKLAQKLKDNDYVIYNQTLIRKASVELIIVHKSVLF